VAPANAPPAPRGGRPVSPTQRTPVSFIAAPRGGRGGLDTAPDASSITAAPRGTGGFTYYLGTQNFSIAGTGNADGTVIERLDYSSTGDFAGGGPGATSFYHDADGDGDLDLRDFANLQVCFDPSGTETTQACLDVHDFDTADASDGDIDLDDFHRFAECFRGLFVTPDQACGLPLRRSTPPPSGTFTLHGRPIDHLADGHTLLDFRARSYDPALGRWLQRDPSGFADGPSLYDAFRANPLRYTDPLGLQTPPDTFPYLRYAEDPVVIIRSPFAGLSYEEGVRARREYLEATERDLFSQPVSVLQGETTRNRQAVLNRLVSEKLRRYNAGVLYNIAPLDDPYFFVSSGVGNVEELNREIWLREGAYSAEVTSVVTGLASGVLELTHLPAFVRLVESLPFRAAPRVPRVPAPRDPSALVAGFPGVSPSGEVNLLNVARRGVPLTSEELTILRTAPAVDPAPLTTEYFNQRILGDFVKYGRLRGRLGNIQTRVATANELAVLESPSSIPQLEFFVRGVGPGTRGAAFPDIAVFDPAKNIVEFVQLTRNPLSAQEIKAAQIIRRAYPNVPIRYVIISE
jgi:RHS repeat-associated protein